MDDAERETLRDAVRQFNGLYVGQLSQNELADFTMAVSEGIACREFEGVGSWLGIAKVRVLP